MKYIQIGKSNLKVSNIGIGVMRLNALDNKAAENTIRYSFENGINFFESADIYGKNESSIRLGQALKDANIDRSKVVLQSKGGINRNGETPEFDFSYDHLIKVVDGELKRLQTDYLDVFLLHRPDVIADMQEIAKAFNDLQDSRKVRNFGVSNQNPGQIELLKKYVKQPLITNQLQFGLGHTKMIDELIDVNTPKNTNEELLTYSKFNEMTIQAWSPVQNGYFGGVIIDNSELPKLNEKLQKIADKYGVSKTAIAIAWILKVDSKMQVISGSTSINHIQETIEGSEIELTRSEWYELYYASKDKAV